VGAVLMAAAAFWLDGQEGRWIFHVVVAQC